MKPTSNYLSVRDDWLRLNDEEVIDPSLPIVDAHHHFYDRPGWKYLCEDYLADARSGHDVGAYRAGLAQLAPLGLSYDAWLFLPELLDLAQAFPDTAIIVNHCGGIVRIASYEGRREEVFARWSRAMHELARLPNVHVKLGGLGMRINGFDFEKGATPPTSQQLAQTWKPWVEPWVEPCIEAFGANRWQTSPAQAAQLVTSEMQRWAAVVKAAGIKAD